MPTITQPPAKSGAPLGNTNRADSVKGVAATSHIHMKCRPVDKAKWTKAANLAVKTGHLKPDARGNLASWVVRTLNAAASVQLKDGKLMNIQTAVDILLGNA